MAITHTFLKSFPRMWVMRFAEFQPARISYSSNRVARLYGTGDDNRNWYRVCRRVWRQEKRSISHETEEPFVSTNFDTRSVRGTSIRSKIKSITSCVQSCCKQFNCGTINDNHRYKILVKNYAIKFQMQFENFLETSSSSIVEDIDRSFPQRIHFSNESSRSNENLSHFFVRSIAREIPCRFLAISRSAEANKWLPSYFRAHRRVWRGGNFLAVGMLNRWYTSGGQVGREFKVE